MFHSCTPLIRNIIATFYTWHKEQQVRIWFNRSWRMFYTSRLHRCMRESIHFQVYLILPFFLTRLWPSSVLLEASDKPMQSIPDRVGRLDNNRNSGWTTTLLGNSRRNCLDICRCRSPWLWSSFHFGRDWTAPNHSSESRRRFRCTLRHGWRICRLLSQEKRWHSQRRAICRLHWAVPVKEHVTSHFTKKFIHMKPKIESDV